MKRALILITILISFIYGISNKELAISINLAGKQRMLTQQISKDAMLIKLGINMEKATKDLKEGSALFDRTLKGLMSGDPELKLVPAKDKELLKQLKKVEELWQPFHQRVKDIYNLNNITDETFEYIEKNNLKLLKEMDKAVSMYAKLKNDDGIKLKIANDINLAGKQRMLTQKIAKDLLFYQAGLNPKGSIKDLKKSMKLFDVTIKGLRKGDKKLKLVGTKLPKIRKRLDVVNEKWTNCKPYIKKALKDKANQELTKQIIDCLDLTRDEMNEAVILYTKSMDRQKQKIKLDSLISDFVSEVDGAKHLINLAGRQRMLTQRVSKLSIECKLNLMKDSCSRLDKYRKMYEETLMSFKNGNKKLNIKAVESPESIAQVDKLTQMWKPFSDAVLKVKKSKGKDEEAIKYILDNNEKLLDETNNLVSIFEKENSKNLSYIEKAQLRIVNVAGRQRVLTQKMTKELLAHLYLKMDGFEPKVKESVKLFDKSLKALIDGDNTMSIPKVTNGEIKEQLIKVSKIWKKIKPLYAKKSLSKKELILLLKTNPLLLKEMNKSVKMIEVSTEY